ncbi:hypothetical protein EVAR_55082_1 [Eumeta japonica]|uniref:Uncharacterized protein n=1 Tax=Eumeta variegata TaxID=151549 RepID=A0A4C1Z3R4_EUMVA|nr:hypothetical protein EVAR_55082_1 [Eumeta japonica]
MSRTALMLSSICRKTSLTHTVTQISATTFELVKPFRNSSKGWTFITKGQPKDGRKYIKVKTANARMMRRSDGGRMRVRRRTTALRALDDKRNDSCTISKGKKVKTSHMWCDSTHKHMRVRTAVFPTRAL